jgi:hypothetical protein
MRWLLMGLILLWAAPAFSEEGSPRPAEHKTETTQKDDKNGGNSQQSSALATSIPAPIVNIYTAKHAGEESHCAQPKDWKEWGSVAWCRSLEAIDAERVIAIFTVILGVATWLLWRATDKLVRGAERASEQQLRAYISVNPTEISSTDREERFAQITCIVKNHGQTPAREINYVFDFGVMPNPLPEDFIFPPPAMPINMEGSLFPLADMKVWFNFNRLLSTEEFAAVEADTLRLHVWGRAFYRTAFGQRCYTKIAASVGGPAFIANLRAMRRNTKGPGFNWTWESGHGDGD